MSILNRSVYIALLYGNLLAALLTPRSHALGAELQFGNPVNLGSTINNTWSENSPSLTDDGLLLYFHSNRPNSSLSGANIWMSSRNSSSDPWSEPSIELGGVSGINSDFADNSPHISGDGLTLLYHSQVGEGLGSGILSVTRNSVSDIWRDKQALPAPINEGDPNTDNGGPYLSGDGLSLYFHSNRPGGVGNFDLYEATRDFVGGPWTVENLGSEINTAGVDRKPVVTPDGLTLFFTSDRPGGQGLQDIYFSQRDTIDGAWDAPVNLGPTINTADQEEVSDFWAAENLLFFKSGSGRGMGLAGEGGADMFSVTVVPEPSSMAMSLCGLIFASAYMRTRRRRVGESLRKPMAQVS